MSRTIQPRIYSTLLGLLLLQPAPPLKAQQTPPWAGSTESYNNSPMATALIVMIIVFFFIGFIFVYLRHFLSCLGIHPDNGPFRLTGEGDGTGWMRDPPRGLDPNILKTFPTFLYSDVKLHRVTKTTPLECAICLNEFLDHELLQLLPKCSHVFHPHCIIPWLASRVTCPVCRANLEVQVHIIQRPNSNNNELTSDDDEHEPSDQIIDDHHRDLIKGLSESGRMRLHRSHSTGHSLVENSDRFTLRLPQEVRNKFVNNNNNVDNLSGLLPIVSPRVGYRAGSVGSCSTISGKMDRWRFFMSPPLMTRRPISNLSMGLLRSPISLIKSMKSPNKLLLKDVGKGNDIGERSSDRWADIGLEEMELESR